MHESTLEKLIDAAVENDRRNMANEETAKARAKAFIRKNGISRQMEYLESEAIWLMTTFSDERTADLEAERDRAVELLRAWNDWFNGPFSEGVSYINPPMTRTAEFLKELKGK